MTFDAPKQGGPAPDGGVMRDGVHLFPVRVYYEYTDAGGIVYHADYLRFAERARTEMMRLLGLNHLDLMAQSGVTFAVAHCEMTFHRPARLDDLVLVETRLTEVGGASMRLRQDIRRGADLLVGLRLRLAMMTPEGRAGRIPRDLRQALRDHMTGRPDGGAPPSSDAPET